MALREKLALQLHAAALHFHCLSTSHLLTAIEALQKMFIDAASVLADFLSEAAPAARRGRAMAKAGAMEPNGHCFQKALKWTFLPELPAPLSNYRILWSEMEARCCQASFSHAK